MRAKLCLVAATVLSMWALKRCYADARVDDLWWMLTPTARLAGAATGATFIVAPGEGYFSRERLFLIEKSCAGINFLIAAFGMLACALGLRVNTWRQAARVLALSAAVSYAAAVVVNATRIAIAMWLAAQPVGVAGLSAAQAHRLEGIVVYFGGLVALHDLVLRPPAEGGAVRRLAWPLVCYYAITLAVPLLNGSGSGSGFAGHAAVVLTFPLVLIALAWAVRTGVISVLYGEATSRGDRLPDGSAGVDGGPCHTPGANLGARAHA